MSLENDRLDELLELIRRVSPAAEVELKPCPRCGRVARHFTMAHLSGYNGHVCPHCVQELESITPAPGDAVTIYTKAS